MFKEVHAEFQYLKRDKQVYEERTKHNIWRRRNDKRTRIYFHKSYRIFITATIKNHYENTMHMQRKKTIQMLKINFFWRKQHSFPRKSDHILNCVYESLEISNTYNQSVWKTSLKSSIIELKKLNIAKMSTCSLENNSIVVGLLLLKYVMVNNSIE